MNICHQRHLAPGGAQLAGNVLQVGSIHLGLRRQADDFTTGLSQRKRFAHAAGGVQRIAGQHGLNADGIGATNPHVPHHHLAGQAARILVQTRAMQCAHALTLLRISVFFKFKSRSRILSFLLLLLPEA